MKKIRWQKETHKFVEHGYGLEFPLHQQRDYLTPNHSFFVCNATDTPVIDVANWRLTICGDGITEPLELSYDTLCQLPQKTVPAFIECAGNQRFLFEDSMGEKLNKRPQVTELLWGLGGVGMAEWCGVPLVDILRASGISDNAVHVCPFGLDASDDEGGQICCPLPVEKALDPDTLVALKMNGETLPPDHGFPACLVVPGWVGTYSIKWLDRIATTTTHQWVHRNTQLYVLSGDHWSQEKYAPAQGPPIYQQNIKSSLALPWHAKLSPGRQSIHGYARSPDSCIETVEWSADDGTTWTQAALTSRNQQYAWVKFTFEWDASVGEHRLRTRATDKSGRRQPNTVPFNNGGYLFNAVHAHPVKVEF